MKPIEVFVRHNVPNQSTVVRSGNVQRPSFFSIEKCFQNLKKTCSFDLCNITCLVDGDINLHFLNEEIEADVVNNLRGGSDAASFVGMLDYVLKKDLPNETIVYFVENDYLHNYKWCEILIEGINLIGNNGYVTMYDHFDKYMLSVYPSLESQIYVTKSCHWRTVPSTTSTFATTFETIKRDAGIHMQYCDIANGANKDHSKFLRLKEIGRRLISSIPGYSTHCDNLLSPVVDWSNL